MAVALRTAEQQEKLDAIAHETTGLRPLPAIATRLIEMAASTRFSAQDLALTVSTDQALTMKILRLANSPFFGMPRRITSLRDAVVLLGFREVRSMALAACMMDATGAAHEETLDYGQFWCNSLVIGRLAQVLAEAEGHDRDAAFTAGVLHNVGRLALAQQRPREFMILLTQARALGIALSEVERSSLGFTDAELGAAITRGWKFPDSLCDAVARHDAPLSSFADSRDLDATVARARRFARAHGVTDGIDPPSALEPDQEWQEPRIASTLDRSGGPERIIEWAASFLDHTRAA